MQGAIHTINPRELYGLIDVGESYQYYFKADDVVGGRSAFHKLHVGDLVTFEDTGEEMMGGQLMRAEKVK